MTQGNIALVFDTETTGLPVKTNDLKMQPKIIELAAVAIDLNTGEELGEFDNLFDPKQKLDKKITEITGLTDEDLKDQPLFGERQQAFLGLMAKCDTIIAHNATFDLRMVEFEMKRLGMDERWSKTIQGLNRICTVEQTIFIRKHRLKLSDLYQILFDESFEGAHRAMVDVKALARCAVGASEAGDHLMSHIDGEVVRTLLEACDIQASDDIGISLDFGDVNQPLMVGGRQMTLRDLRNIAQPFAFWVQS